MGPFSAYFQAEHQALGVYFRGCLRNGVVEPSAFDLFRRRLLQRIAVEEKVLFPALAEALGSMPTYRSSLTRDHRGLVAICAPTPYAEWVDGLWDALEFHHSLETADGGFAAQCDELLGPQAVELIAKASSLPQVKVRPFEDGQGVRARIAALLRATGVV